MSEETGGCAPSRTMEKGPERRTIVIRRPDRATAHRKQRPGDRSSQKESVTGKGRSPTGEVESDSKKTAVAGVERPPGEWRREKERSHKKLEEKRPQKASGRRESGPQRERSAGGRRPPKDAGCRETKPKRTEAIRELRRRAVGLGQPKHRHRKSALNWANGGP